MQHLPDCMPAPWALWQGPSTDHSECVWSLYQNSTAQPQPFPPLAICYSFGHFQYHCLMLCSFFLCAGFWFSPILNLASLPQKIWETQHPLPMNPVMNLMPCWFLNHKSGLTLTATLSAIFAGLQRSKIRSALASSEMTNLLKGIHLHVLDFGDLQEECAWFVIPLDLTPAVWTPASFPSFHDLPASLFPPVEFLPPSQGPHPRPFPKGASHPHLHEGWGRGFLLWTQGCSLPLAQCWLWHKSGCCLLSFTRQQVPRGIPCCCLGTWLQTCRC